jgi:hypothetical protein
MLIYSNGESLQKSIVKVFKKKIIEDCIQEVMFDQCICGNKELVKVSIITIWNNLTLILYILLCYLHVSLIFIRIISHYFFRCPSTCWLAKNKKQGSLEFTCILVCLKSSSILTQDRK